MIIEAAKGGHTQVVKLLLEYPNRVLMNSPELAQLTDPHISEVREVLSIIVAEEGSSIVNQAV